MRTKGRLHDRLHSGASACGLFVPFASPHLVEITGGVGYDFVIVDTEHGAPASESVENMIRAGDVVGVDCVVRIPRGAYAEAQRAMDAGAAGILAPHVITAADARELVSVAHYPPRGRRGYAGTARSGEYGLLGKQELRERAAKMLAMAQIEDAEAIENLEDIAAVPGLDVLFIGPADLAMSVGMEGAEYDAYLREVIRRAAASAARDQLTVGCFARTGADAAALLPRGIGLVALSATGIVVSALRAECAASTAGQRVTTDGGPVPDGVPAGHAKEV